MMNYKLENMETYIALLRGINVSGHKMIKMDALREMFLDLNFINPQTYIQSGNVIFQDKKGKPEVLEKKITKQILNQFGFEVPVLVTGLDKLNAVLKNNPFVNDKKVDLTKLHVTLLSQVPTQIAIEKIKNGNYNSDEFILIGKVVYLFCPDGYGKTKLTNTFFENKLKVKATTRNWKTIGGLVKIAQDISNN